MSIQRILLAAGWLVVSGTTQAGAILLDSTTGVDASAYSVVSTAFSDLSLGGFRAAGADDFTVPASGWRINGIQVRGRYADPLNVGQAGPASSVNVFILPKTAATPTSTNLPAIAVWHGLNLPFTDTDSGDFDIVLPNVDLAGGNYWLVVQANTELLAVGQWEWTESSLAPNSGTTLGDESAWFQSAAGFASPITGTATCVGIWGTRVSSCQMSRNPDTNPPFDRDFAFVISGQVFVPGVTVSPTSLITSEDGSSVSYSVVLDAPPLVSETVTITPSSNDTTEGTVSAALVFDSANWATPQLVTVTPGASGDGNDGNVGYLINNSVSTTGGGYSGITAASVAVSNQNIDGIATIVLNPTSAITVSEDGTMTAVVTIAAGPDVTPAADVTVALTNNNSADVSLSTSTVVLTAGNGYSTTLTISGVADDVREVNEAFTVTTSPSVSTDAAYNGVDPSDISGTVIDSNVVEVVVTPSSTPLNLSESGLAASIGYALTAQPAANVSFTLSSTDSGEAGVSGAATLTFTAANWNVVQSVSITPVDDAIVDGSQPFSIIATPTSSADPFWNNVPVAAVAGNVADDDTAVISVDLGDGVVTSEAGGTDTFTLVLGAAPAADVSLDVRSNNPIEGLLSLTGAAPFAATRTLTFTTANWNVPQTVTVAGQNDGVVDGDHAYVVITENIVSTAPGYAALTDADVADVPAVNIGLVAESTPVPTLSNALLGLMALLMAGIAALTIQTRRRG